MSRPATKADLISAATENYEEMNRLIALFSEKNYQRHLNLMIKRKKHIGKEIKIFVMFWCTSMNGISCCLTG